MELLDNNVFKGKFMGASDSLVLFKTELDGGKILEQERSIKNLVLESGHLLKYFQKIHNNQKKTNCKRIKN